VRADDMQFDSERTARVLDALGTLHVEAVPK
jgi:hypothetical protein